MTTDGDHGKCDEKAQMPQVGISTTEKNTAAVKSNARIWVEIVISEGENRQVRRLCQRAGFRVCRLARAALGPLELEDLPLKIARSLTAKELKACYNLALPGLPVPSVLPLSRTATAPRSHRYNK